MWPVCFGVFFLIWVPTIGNKLDSLHNCYHFGEFFFFFWSVIKLCIGWTSIGQTLHLLEATTVIFVLEEEERKSFCDYCQQVLNAFWIRVRQQLVQTHVPLPPHLTLLATVSASQNNSHLLAISNFIWKWLISFVCEHILKWKDTKYTKDGNFLEINGVLGCLDWNLHSIWCLWL